jgi:hypothetical protein
MLDPITTVETPMRLMCFASWMISDAVCDALSVNKPKVLVIVHSFIRRLESWMERTKSDLSSTIDTKLHGVGGRQVHSLKHFDRADKFEMSIIIKVHTVSIKIFSLLPQALMSPVFDITLFHFVQFFIYLLLKHFDLHVVKNFEPE